MSNEWIFSLPKPNFGSLVDGFYNAGCMLEDDGEAYTDADSKMQILTDVTAEDFEGYKKQLAEAGYKINLENKLGENLFADVFPFHLSYFAARGEMRVIEDKTSTSIDEFGYSARGEGKTVIYQYGLFYDPKNGWTERTCNCGMFYVIHLSDNSLFMIDGGLIFQWPEVALDALWTFLRRITGTSEGEKIRISGWYITHGHPDHLHGCVKLLNRHHDDIIFERFIANFTSCQMFQAARSLNPLRDVIKAHYPEAKLLKAHSGQKFSLADSELEFYFAQEDAVEREDITKFALQDYNCTSAILKFSSEGRAVMFLGDTNVETEELMARISTREIWEADLVQVSHHCFNYLDTLYEWIHAPTAMLPNSYYGGHAGENVEKLAGVIKHLSHEDNIYYEGEETTGFAVVDGRWTKISSEPIISSEYDMSGF